MKIKFTLLLISLFLYSLSYSNEGKILKISEDHQLTKIECGDDGEVIYFGFAFLATTFGFTSQQEFVFYLDNPFYTKLKCFIRFPVEGLEQIILCYIVANIFPLFEEVNNITLPKTLRVIDDFFIEDWEKTLGSSIIEIEKCAPTISKTFIPSNKFSVDCNQEDINVLTISGSFLDEISKKDFIISGEDEQIVYNFQPYLIVDGNLNIAECYIYISYSNEGDDQLKCLIPGFKNVRFFPTTAVLSNGVDTIRLDGTEEITLKPCGHDVTPSDETPSDETPSDETPSDETPSDESPSDESPSDDTSSDVTPSDVTPSDITPSDTTPNSHFSPLYISITGLFMILLLLI